MAYAAPPYISKARVDDQTIRFVWDDTRPKDFYLHGSEEALQKLAPVSLRAKFVAAIGIYEWIVWRFHLVSDDPAPSQIAEAAWCASINPSYMRYFELDRKKWLGPVRGPLWCAATILSSMIFYYEEEEEPAARVAFLSSLAIHVLPKTSDFEQWGDKIINRLTSLYRASADPFDNLFGGDEALGPIVSRSALDPDAQYDPSSAKTEMTTFLQGVNYTQNPFLLSPEELLDEGFEGIPYGF